MNDYKELIDQLRKDYHRLHKKCYSCLHLSSEKLNCGVRRYDIASIIWEMKAAAGAIEQLVKERDAAIADLKEINLCSYCKNQNEHIIGTNTETGEQKDLGECGHSRGLFHQLCLNGKYSRCDRWEWRGVQDE